MKRGDVIVCAFPHASSTPSKSRPAVVVQADFYNERIKNLLVAGVTSVMTNLGDNAHFFIEAASEEGRRSGLKSDSLVSCINLAVIPPSRCRPTDRDALG
ncbi:MAG: type II toxin-antitoxin system PemK/MazF family toxin [Planctomycetia bacterium]|nr:type II toxin-antitoxin system PemK/MazF family toxin [Planctomycetia bacterium]